jgi:hypothetical protein
VERPLGGRFAAYRWSTKTFEFTKRQTPSRTCGRVERRTDGSGTRSMCCGWGSVPSLPSASAEKVFNNELHCSINYSEIAAQNSNTRRVH